MRVAMVLQAKPGLPDVKSVLDAAHTFPGLGGLGIKARQGNALPLTLGDRLITVGAVPSPVPDGEAAQVARHSLSGVSTKWSLPEHQGHLVIAMGGEEKAQSLQDLVGFTRVVAALCKATGGLGVYWGAAPATHEPSFFCEMAHEALPVMLWVGVSMAPAVGGRLELLSRGMKQLGFADLLLTVNTLDEELVAFFYDLVSYAVKRGALPKDGDTVGRSAEEKLVVKFGPSPIAGEPPVWRVDLDTPKPVQ
jgi:hypothetical protein